jgi:hypothetical protein
MTKVKVLFLGADPVSADPRKPLQSQPARLKIDEEMRAIVAKVRAADHRDSLDFTWRSAVRADDFLQYLNEVRPHIFHFSGHGNGAGEIIVVGKDGIPHPVRKPALLSLFRTLKDDLRVVLLNACHSLALATAVTQVVDCAIGMSTKIGDNAAITFAASFYRALGFGYAVQNAFDQGKTALLLENIPEEHTPQLVVREGVDPTKVILVNPLADPWRPVEAGVKGPTPTVHATGGSIAFVGDVRNASFTVHNEVIGESPETRAKRASECVGVIRDELQWNLQRLASQILHTCVNVPAGNPVPRRPGETREQFEDRDRDWFAREVEFVFSMYQQFALEDAVHASQRTNVASLDEELRLFVGRAYAAVNEVRNRVFLYRDRMQKLAVSDSLDSDRRGALAHLYSKQTANAFTSLWFELLENWVMLEPDETAICIVQGILRQVVGGSSSSPTLLPGEDGWRYAAQQRARLHAEKMLLDQEEARLTATPSQGPGEERKLVADFTEAIGKASLAYLEGRAADSVKFLEEALRFPGVRDDYRHYARTSLEFLRDPGTFEGAMGAYLLEVEETGLAAQAGFRKGDVIIRYNGSLVTEPLALSRLIPQAKGAPLVPVEAVRDGERLIKYVRGGASLCTHITALVYVESLAV